MAENASGGVNRVTGENRFLKIKENKGFSDIYVLKEKMK
jgi:hypothetical protein